MKKSMKEYYELAKNNNLKKIREQKGVRQRDLACACFQNASEISRYELGKSMPSFVVLLCISKFLEVSIEEIYPGLHELYKKLDEQVLRAKESWENKMGKQFQK